jgi:vacuolar iron transporter family protein
MSRPSNHVEPSGALATARHYIRDLVYGASDGIVTTFAVVSGVAGGSLSPAAVLIVGAANLAADGLSMGVGNFLAIRANERARAADSLPEEEAYPSKHGLATFAAFITAGSVPLLPYLVDAASANVVVWSVGLTLSTMFGLGAARAFATEEAWWKAGLESLMLGSLVAAAAYVAGALVAALVGGATPGAENTHVSVSPHVLQPALERQPACV